MSRSGLHAQVGFALESNYGMPVTPTVFVPLLGGSLATEIEKIMSDSIIAGRYTRTSEQVNDGNLTSGGDVQFELYLEQMLKLFKSMMGGVATTGSGPYTHVFTPDELFGTSLTMQFGLPGVGGVVHPLTFAGTKVSGWELSLANNEVGQLGLSVVSQREYDHRSVTDAATTSSDATLTSASAAFTDADVGKPISGAGIPAATTILSVTSATSIEMSANASATATGVTVAIGVPLAAASYTAQRPLTFRGGTVSVGGSVVKAKSLTISGENPMDTERRFIGSPYMDEPIDNDLRVYDGSIEAEFVDMTQYRRFTNSDEFEISTALTAAGGSIAIEGNAYYIGETPQISGRGVVPQNLPFEFVADNDDASALSITVVNSESTV